MGFFLRHGCQNRQDHASVTVQGVDIIRFKFYPYRWVKILQRFDNRKAVNDISGKTGDGLCKNQVNLSRLTILDQLLHSFAVCQRSAADSFIIINANKLPAGLCLNVVRIIIFLKLIRGGLFIIVSGNTYIGSDTTNRGAFSKPLHNFGRDNLQFGSIHASISVSNSLLTIYRFCSTAHSIVPLIPPVLCSNTTGASSDNFGCRVLSLYFLLFCG